MNVTIRKVRDEATIVPRLLLGHNLEMTYETDRALLANRVANPHFAAPVDPRTNLAEKWVSWSNTNFQGVRFEHIAHGGPDGMPAQVVNNFGGRPGFGIAQRNIPVIAGERLQAVIWARTQCHPVRLIVQLRPQALTLPPYAQADVVIDKAWFSEYHVELTPSADDPAAMLVIMCDEGEVWFSYVRVEPQGAGVLSAVFDRALSRLPLPILRWPGGCITTAYHWRHGIGPRHLRPTMPDFVFKYHVSHEFGTDAYLDLCERHGAVPHITVNLTTGTPEEAAEWAAYCARYYRSRGKEPPRMYWHIGNEHYAFWEVGHMTGPMYAEALAQWVPPIRRAYPGARIVALGVDDYDSRFAQGAGGGWRREILARAAEHIDVLAFQWYRVEDWIADDRARLVSVLADVAKLEAKFRRALADIGACGRDITLALTEWNYWVRAFGSDGKGFHEPYDTEHALFVAAVLHRLAAMVPAVELAEIYHLVNAMGILEGTSVRVTESCLAPVFRLYHAAFGGSRCVLNVDCPLLGDGVPAVEALAVRNGAMISLVVVNRSPDQEARIVLEGITPAGDCELLAGTSLDSQLCELGTTPANGDSAVTVPKLSIARIPCR